MGGGFADGAGGILADDAADALGTAEALGTDSSEADALGRGAVVSTVAGGEAEEGSPAVTVALAVAGPALPGPKRSVLVKRMTP